MISLLNLRCSSFINHLKNTINIYYLIRHIAQIKWQGSVNFKFKNIEVNICATLTCKYLISLALSFFFKKKLSK